MADRAMAISPNPDTHMPLFAEMGGIVPPAVAVAAESEWEAIRDWWTVADHQAPKPPWALRPFSHDGTEAWHHLRKTVLPARTPRDFSAYIHVPFCEQRCGFCDLCSEPCPPRWPEREALFADRLCREIDDWAAQPSLTGGTVTTVHLGGGTPTVLTAPVLRQIIGAFRAAFSTRPATEWALESTSRRLADLHLDELRQLGFTRLHVGVQTLDDGIRRLLGRKEPAEDVVHRVRRAKAFGFIVSADILYGLPGQRTPDLVNTLQRLVDVELDGFSLYQLQRTPRNSRFLDRCGARREPLRDYVLFQVGEHFLRYHGYRKTFFTHFARPHDRNLYYSHVTRGEDLLALGPTADGVFGDYIYRHPERALYEAQTSPALEGGMQATQQETRLRPVTAALMNAAVHRSMLNSVDAGHLGDMWLACGALKAAQEPGLLELTANGSWFISSLISQLNRIT